MGRPSTYSDDVADYILAEMVEGRSLRSICAKDAGKGVPTKKTVQNWLRTHPEFMERYRAAQLERAEGYIEEIMDIADDGSNDWMQANDPDNPGFKLNGEHIQRSRLRVDTRKWIAAKMHPNKFGEKISVGGDATGSPIRIETIAVRLVKPDGA